VLHILDIGVLDVKFRTRYTLADPRLLPISLSAVQPMTIDLRSDTATQPTDAMRRAMACADVGDDGAREDPTVNKLEERCAEVVGKDAAVFVASGTMANQLAMLALARAGHIVVCAEGAHVANKERGASALMAGLSFAEVPSPYGELSGDQVGAVLDRYPRSVDLVVVENTHQSASGFPWSPAAMGEAAAAAHAAGVAVYMDGARLFNAAVARGVLPLAYCDVVDGLMFCLSKGLGAPVGSVVCGSEPFVEEVRERKLQLGGGWRQAGILAAAGLIALGEGRSRLAEDHATARQLADGIAAASPGVVDPETVRTNIVFADPEPLGVGAVAMCQRLSSYGVLCKVVGNRLRLVTHRDITAEHIQQALTQWRRAADSPLEG
jgi:threonine aldolase